MMKSADKQWYLSELADELGKQPSSLQRELQSLVEAGVLRRQVIGRKVYFRVNSSSPVFSPLREIFESTTMRTTE